MAAMRLAVFIPALARDPQARSATFLRKRGGGERDDFVVLGGGGGRARESLSKANL